MLSGERYQPNNLRTFSRPLTTCAHSFSRTLLPLRILTFTQSSQLSIHFIWNAPYDER